MKKEWIPLRWTACFEDLKAEADSSGAESACSETAG